MKIAAILFDLGDTIMMEQTEVKGAEQYGLNADLIDGMDSALRGLKSRGYKLGIVADAHVKTVENILWQHGLYDLFDVFAISQQVGCEKPDPRMFLTALTALKIASSDYSRVLMVGNNPTRDVRGANRLGLISIWLHWNNRYLPDPDFADTPMYEVRSARELIEVIEKIERI